MQDSIRTCGSGRRGRLLGKFAAGLLCALGLWSSGAMAATSVYCPAPLTAMVANGGTVDINVSTCDGPFDGGLSGVSPLTTAHGTATIGPNSGGTQLVTYAHGGDTATSDTFVFLDNDNNDVTFNITISAPTSAIVVSPATLPTLTAGTAFSQTLTSSGGSSPYSYSLSGGSLPLGLSLTSAGVISGTPTQRGAYSFSVRSQDSIGDFVNKGYTGTVQNPTLSITPTSGTAIQSVAFSQTLTASGGVAPHTFALESGSFPAGISISSSGVVSGTTAAAAGSYPVTLRVTDSSTPSASAYFELESYTLTVSPPPSVSIAVAPATVSEDGATNLVYTVTRSLNLTSATVVNITTSGTATSGSDYTGGVATATIAAGATTATITINPTVDGTVEADETVILTVAAGTGYTVGSPSSATGTILNDDVPSASISVAPASVTEDGASNLIYTVTLSQASVSPVSVNFTASGTATSGTDYAAVTSPLAIPAGNTTGTITINPAADATPESDETVILTLNAGTGYVVGAPTSATGTLLNDDVPVTLSPASLPNGTVAAGYSQTVTASGGTGPYSFAITAGALPAGLTLSSGGALSGTPTAGGTFNFTVTATDSSAFPGPFSGSRAYALTIAAPTIALAATSLAGGTTGQAYSAAIAPASGGTAPYSYAVTAGALPSGLTLNAGTGAVTGTPTAVGTFNFSITATDSSTGTGPYTATQSYAITVVDVPPVANPVSITVAYGSGANPVTLNITGAAPTSVAIATAPANGTAIASGTSITYQPTTGYAGPDSFTYTATNSGGTSAPATVTVTVQDPVITITASGGFSATTGSAYSQTFTWNGGAQPWSGFQVTNLPAGMAITGTTANSVTVSGTPTQAGSFSLNASATDSSTGNGPYTVGQAFALAVSAPTLALSPAPGSFIAAYGTPFSTSFTASGGVGPYTYAHTGALPAGLTFSNNTLSGVPVASGAFTFTVIATDTGSTGTGAPFTVSQSYDILVSGPTVVIAPSTLPNVDTGTVYTQTLTAGGGIAPYAFSLTSGALPTGMSLSSSGTLSGNATQVGTFNFTATATDANGFTGSRAYTLIVQAPALTMTPGTGTLTLPYGAPYSQAFAASGSTGPYNYVLAGALPAGVTFSGGTLAGTPTTPGSYPVTITATDTTLIGVGAPFSIAQNYTLDVPAPAIVVDPATLPGTTAGQAYTQSITATGGVAPYSFAVTAGALPGGLSLASGGALSGTTTASGTFNFTVAATDSFGQIASRAYTVVVAVPTMTLTPGTLPAGTAGAAYSQALTIGGGIAPYTVTQTGALPAGIGFDAATRTFSGTATQSGSFNITVTVTDSTAGAAATVTSNYTLTIAAPALTLSPASLPAGAAGIAYSQIFVAGSGVAPYTYTVGAGALPAGLVLDAGTGALSGTPTAAGTFNFSVTATDSTTGTAGTATNAYTLTISAPSITVDPPLLPNGVVGVPYTHELIAVGGVAPYTFAVTAGALPAGLTLGGDGRITGEPAAGAFAFTVTATDALGFSGVRAYSIQVIERPDPSRDPEVRGLLEAQSDSARRFASAQMGNFQQRLENLHDNREGAQLSNRLSFAVSQSCVDYMGRKPGDPCGNLVASNDAVASTHAATAAQGTDSGSGAAQASANSPFSAWIGGVVRSGNQDGRGGGAGADFETDGVSIGADYRFSPAFALGAGLGYGRDESDVGDNGSRVEGDAFAMVLYASYHPGDRYFLDAVAGHQRLSYDLRRYIGATGGQVEGSRDGRQWFGSLSAGAQFQHDTWQLTPYARVDISRATLDGYVEQGDPAFSLAYGDQDVDSTTGNIGLRFESRHETAWGAFAPQVRLEYQHDFNGDSSATMQYADLLTGPIYRADLAGFDRNRFMAGVGGVFYLPRALSLRAEYRGLFGNGGDRDNGFMLNLEKSY